MSAPIPTHRKILYSAVMLVVAVLLLEGGLALVPALMVRRDAAADAGEGDVVVCVGDSVTAGVGIAPGQSWPDHLSLQLLRRGTPLLREATPGAGVVEATQRARALLAELPPTSRPIVLVMIGHNDALRWEPGARQGFEAYRRTAGEGAAVQRRQPWRGPRLLRILRWGLGAARAQGPQVAVEGLLARMAQELSGLSDDVIAHQGRLFLLTYLVPGPPPAGLDPALAGVVQASRLAQAEVNASLRHAAAVLPSGLIDLERTVPVGAQWDVQEFVDHIHLSATTSARAAAAVLAALEESGAIAER